MRKVRKKWLSILLTLALLVGLMVPFAGSAVAGEPVIFSNATKNGVERNTDTDLGWIRLNLQQEVNTGGKLYITVDLPSGVKWVAKPNVGHTVTHVVYSDVAPSPAGANPSLVKASGDRTLTVEIPDTVGDGNIWIQFRNNSQVRVDDTAASDIKVKVTAKEIDDQGFVVWTRSGEFVVGTIGDAEVTVSAETPKVVSFSFFADKKGSNIVLTENVAKALSVGEQVYLELPENYVWNFPSGYSVSGPYGLTLSLVAATNGTRKATFNVSGNRILADSVKIEPVFQIRPGAVEGDVTVNVTSSDRDLKEATVVIAQFGAAPVTVSVEDSANLKTVKVAAENQPVNNIKLKSDLNLKKDSTIILSLPAGYEWAENPACDGMYAGRTTIYDSKSKVYMQIEQEKTEYIISNLKVTAKASAKPGPLYVTVSGTAGANATVQVANVKARATAEATVREVKIGGLKEAAGDIVITETDKDMFAMSANGTITLSLPAGIKFADTVKYKVNDGDEEKIPNSSGATSVSIRPTFSSLKVDKITFTNIKYDVDSRFSGDVVVKIGGTALNTISDSTDAVLEVVNAKAVSPTKRTAVFTLGSSVYTVNGTQYTMDVAAYVKDGRTYLPVRYVAYALGVDPENIFWDNATQTVTLLKGTNAVQLTIGSNVLKLNGISITMDVAPEIVSGRTMLPFRFIAQALGATVSWDAVTQTVTMNLE